jgi:hypothetical protein
MQHAYSGSHCGEYVKAFKFNLTSEMMYFIFILPFIKILTASIRSYESDQTVTIILLDKY